MIGAIVVLLALTLPEVSDAYWGAKMLESKHRPDKKWTTAFSNTPDVTANGSIAQAIRSCDSVVGNGKPCVIGLAQGARGLPLRISRSNTKLLGRAGMQSLTTNRNGAFISIGDNTNRVIIENIDMRGRSAGNNEIYGIMVSGKRINRIMIRGNKIHHFRSNRNAHGIAVYGTGGNSATAIRHVTIHDNDVHSMSTGSSESIVVNGNVVQWEITHNDLWSINNIAIDAIGGEGTSPTMTKNGRVLPGSFDAARYGFIEDNYVDGMSTLGNPAYGGKRSWAAAIYIDGGRHILVKDNVVKNSPWAYEIGAENCLISRDITLIGNSAVSSHYGDLVLGGYRKKGYRSDRSINCNPKSTQDSSEGHGDVANLLIKNNRFNSAGTKVGRIKLQNRVRASIIAQPGVKAENSGGNGWAQGDANAIRISE